jgi:Protein of unknown function (DUF3558)
VLPATACSGGGGAGQESAVRGTGATTAARWVTPDGKPPSSTASRPAAVALDDVQPCDLLTEDQRGELGLSGEQTSDFSSTWGSDTCRIWDTDKVLSASVTAVTNDGIDGFYAGRFTNLRYKTTEVRGFPALFYRFENVEHACYLAVDVADGQLVDVAFGANEPDSSDASHEELCETAHRVTEAAVDSLLANR